MKHFILLAIFLLPSISQIASAQSLAERRAVETYKEQKLPSLQTKINEAAGFEVPLTIEWDKIALPGGADNYSNDSYFTNVFFTPLAKALSSIAKDELGKEALKEKLKTIKITYDKETAPATNYANGIAFKEGVLSLNFQPFTNANDTDARSQAIVKVLESSL